MVDKNNEQITAKTDHLNSIDDEFNSIQQPVRDTLSMFQNSEISKSIAIKKMSIENTHESIDKLLS